MGERLLQALGVRVPRSEVEIEVVSSIAFLREGARRRGYEARGKHADEKKTESAHSPMVREASLARQDAP
jgi:hypothetical protein